MSGAWTLFFFEFMKERMVLRHAFIKKAQKTPQSELDTARARKTKLFKGDI